MKTKQSPTICRLLAAYQKAGRAAQRAAEKSRETQRRLRALPGFGESSAIGFCYDETSAQGSVPVALYLSVFPDAVPEIKEFEDEGRRKAYTQYPIRLVGDYAGVFIFLRAHTTPQDLGPVIPVPATATPLLQEAPCQ